MSSLVLALSLGLGVAEARETEVQVSVVDRESQPLPTAFVQFSERSDRLSVDAETGSIRQGVLYLFDGTELVMEPGVALDLFVTSPGYETARLQHVVARRGLLRGRDANHLRVSLTPLDLSRLSCLSASVPSPEMGGEPMVDVAPAEGADSQRCSLELAALGAYQAWVETEEARASTWSLEREEAAAIARNRALTLGREATDWAGAAGMDLELVPTLCRSMTGTQDDCVEDLSGSSN